MASGLLVSSRLMRVNAVKFSSQHLGSERLHPRSQGGVALPDLLRADQPQAWILREPLGDVHVFLAGKRAVDGAPKQIGQPTLRVLAAARVGQVLFDELPEAASLVHFAVHSQALIAGDS
jgi:hypothetical protein